MNTNLINLGLSKRITNALDKAGISTLETLSKMSDEELEEIKGISKKSIEEIHKTLESLPKNDVVHKEVGQEQGGTSTSLFNENSLYIFTKKKYTQSEGKKAYSVNKGFVNSLNGQALKITADGKGYISDKRIKKEWCIVK